MAKAGNSPAAAGRWSPVLRALGLFWLSVLLALGTGLGVLQLLGPLPHTATAPEAAPPPHAEAPAKPPEEASANPREEAPAKSAAEPAEKPSETPHETASAEPKPAAAPAVRPPGAPIPDADPALLESSRNYAGAMLPRHAAGHPPPSQAYAASFDSTDPRPRIGVLMAGMGMSELNTEEAIRGLPPAVSFAVAPYAHQPDRLLAAARARGHEIFLSLPMEPFNYPNNDAGPQALLNSRSPADNALRLEWSLSRFTGYVGVTGAMNGMHGERLVAATSVFAPVLAQLAARGLLYVDARPGVRLQLDATTRLPSMRDIDLIIDAPAVRVEIEAKLARLEQIARETGSALGMADTPSPVVIERISVWAAALGQRGFLLAPVSAVVATRPREAPAP